MIKGKNISLTLSGINILDSISFEAKKGRISALIGESGAGKTSLLKCIANMYCDYDGAIECEGENIKKLSNEDRARMIGFVAQHFDLFPHMTVLKNCIHPMTKVLGISYEQAEKKAIETLGVLGIKMHKDKYPSRLSGGQKQRVAIARALCMEPEVLLFDEPTSALDPKSTLSLSKIIKDLALQGFAVVVCSHDMPFVKSVLDIVYFLDNGKIVDFADLNVSNPNKGGRIDTFLSHLD